MVPNLSASDSSLTANVSYGQFTTSFPGRTEQYKGCLQRVATQHVCYSSASSEESSAHILVVTFYVIFNYVINVRFALRVKGSGAG